MPSNHTPTPDMICEAIARAFNTDVDSIRGKSRRTEAMVPREVYMYLLRVRGAFTLPEVQQHSGYAQNKLRDHLKNVRERIRVDQDFAMRVMIAELLIIQDSWKLQDGRTVHFTIQ